jgi:hypothetical protein
MVLRRIRGLFVMAALWTVVWGVVGIVIGLIKWYRGDLIDVGGIPAAVAFSLILRFAALLGLFGAINGLLFATVLALAERRQSIATLSLARFALWGVIATLVVPLLAAAILVVVFGPESFGIELTRLAAIAGLGMACAAAILLIARRGKTTIDEPAA